MGQKLWGITSGSEAMPNWLTDKQKKNTYATKAGWVLRHASGIEETIVAVSRLSTRLGSASPAKVRWMTVPMFTNQSNCEVGVEFNEPVFLDGSCTMQLMGGSGVVSINLDNGGSGYSNSAVAVVEGDGFGAQVGITLNNGVITDINLDNAGSGYRTISIRIEDADHDGDDAVISAVIDEPVVITATSDRVEGDLNNIVVFTFDTSNDLGNTLAVEEQSITSGAIYESETETAATLLLSGDVLPEMASVIYD